MKDEAKECIKEQVGLLNKMLKTMIPLYGTSIAGKNQHQLVRHQQQVHVKTEPQQTHPQEHTRPNQIQTQHQVLVKQEISRDSGVNQIQGQHHTLVKQEINRESNNGQNVVIKSEVDARN